jgi:hypothetical protein
MIEIPQLTIPEYWKNLSPEPLSEMVDGELIIEEWRPVRGYEEQYHVSNFGRVKSLGCVNHPESIKAQRFPKNDYLLVSLWLDNKEKKALVHRLVAIAFIPNPKKKKTVNHKKGNRRDNRAWMLEWATQKENADHSFRELGRKVVGVRGGDHARARAVVKLSRDGRWLGNFRTVTEAAAYVGATPTQITEV